MTQSDLDRLNGLTYRDVTVEEHGSIVLLKPNTMAGDEWINENIPEDASWIGHAVACEPRYVGDIVAGMIEAGLEVDVG